MPKLDMETLRDLRALKPPVMHLYRGAPAVRDWSRYQETVRDWALCGVYSPTSASVNERLVNCEFCRDLMKPSSERAKEVMRRTFLKSKGASASGNS